MGHLRLNNALVQLSETQQNIIWTLIDKPEKSLVQTASDLDISVKTLKSHHVKICNKYKVHYLAAVIVKIFK